MLLWFDTAYSISCVLIVCVWVHCVVARSNHSRFLVQRVDVRIVQHVSVNHSMSGSNSFLNVVQWSVGLLLVRLDVHISNIRRRRRCIVGNWFGGFPAWNRAPVDHPPFNKPTTGACTGRVPSGLHFRTHGCCTLQCWLPWHKCRTPRWRWPFCQHNDGWRCCKLPAGPPTQSPMMVQLDDLHKKILHHISDSDSLGPKAIHLEFAEAET